MNRRHVIEPGTAASKPEEESDMPRRTRLEAMPPGPEREQAIIDLYNQGKTTKEIREAVGLTYDSAIYLALKNAGITPNRGGGRIPAARNGHVEVSVEAPVIEGEDSIYGGAEPAVVVEEVVVFGDGDMTPNPAPDDVSPAQTDEPPALALETYVLRVTIMQPVEMSVEVDVSSFDEAVAAAHALPGLVSILGVVTKNALKKPQGAA